MNPHIKYLKVFFGINHKAYLIMSSPEEVTKQIRSITDWIGLWSSDDIELQYSRINKFLIHAYIFPWSKFPSRLYGTIKESEGNTIIEAKIKASYSSLFGFILFTAVGIFCIIKSIKESDYTKLVLGILILTVVPVLIVRYKKYSATVINRRFVDYLSKNFKVVEL